MKNFLLVIFIFTSISCYAQRNLEQALRKGGWSGGLSGWVGWENFKTTDNNSDSKIHGYNFVFNSHNGSLVEDYGVFGFDFQWRQRNRTTSPDPNPNNQSEYSNEKLWFLGLWGRYYIPVGGELALFIEGSGGYAVFDQEEDKTGYGEADYYSGNSANGFAYNAGLGFSIFVSPNAAFEITGRYEGGSLNGENDSSNDSNVKLMDFYILFGFQIFLR